MTTDSPVPNTRLSDAVGAPNVDGAYVLYWMIAARRVSHNFALDHAVALAQSLDKPLLVFEPLRVGYRWAADRHHAFVLGGMADNRERLRGTPAGYYPYVEPTPDAGKGLLVALAADACVVVTDEHPGFFFPRMLDAASRAIAAPLVRVDGCGLLPLCSAKRVFARAYDFRRFLQQHLRDHLGAMPSADPFSGRHLARWPGLPDAILERWPAASDDLLAMRPAALKALPIDHEVGVVPRRGGATAAAARLSHFVDDKVEGYADGHNHPDDDATSGLSPYLHFGHVGAHQVLARLASRYDWTPDDLAGDRKGSREGWWNLPPGPEAFLDQPVTWRELGHNFCFHRDDYDTYESLPEWAKKTLAEHAADERQWSYTLDELERSATHDEIWNAAQNQLRTEGVIHNYLRMLWGKRILEWSPSPRDALEVMIELNDKWAIDGRDPNSYSGIFWVLGRYDRAWGPERPIFGKVRYMSSDNTRRKLRLRAYLRTYAPAG